MTALGLMSGTSLDGLDLCLADFTKNGDGWKFEILEAETIEYSASWLGRLQNAANLSAGDLYGLNSDYGFYLGEKALEFLTKYPQHHADLIASHGHTVLHQPHRKFTVQIGDGRAVKISTGLPVIYDFRSQDVLLGGNGAPLVPVGDELLFSQYDACLNLGGFSNISYKENGRRIAFDICPVNTVLNHFAKLLGKNYDRNGEFAAKGTIIPERLQQLDQLPFYKKQPPKSLGIEWVNECILPLLNDCEPKDALATLTEHAASEIAVTLSTIGAKSVLCTGGGAYNIKLLHRIQELTKTIIVVPDSQIVEFKEALIFAFMGVLKINNEINVLSSATGSSYDHSTGIVV